MLKNKSGQIYVIDEIISNHTQGIIYKDIEALEAAKNHELVSDKKHVIHVAQKLNEKLKVDEPQAGETTFDAQIRAAENVIVELVKDETFVIPQNENLTDQEWSIV